MSDLHVLMLPSFYHTRQKPYSGTFFRDWALALARAGVTVGVGYVEGRSIRGLSWRALQETRFQTTASLESGLPTVRLEGWNTLAQWTAGGMIWARLTQRVIREYMERYGRPDVIAAQSATWAGHAAWLAHHRWGLPYVVTEINTGFGTGKVRGREAAISRRAFAAAEAVIAISEPLHDMLRRFGGARRIDVIPCTVDDLYWTLPPKPRGAGPFTFYGQAHLTPRKGFDLLIRAFASRFRGDQTCRVVIGGGGTIRAELEALAASTGVQSQVSFLGSIPRDVVRDSMWAADCFVLPSHAENFGVVLIEALATGLPVISTRCGGPEDIITDEVGLLLRPGDEQGLADALWTMRNRPAHDPKAIRTYAVARFGYPAVGARLRDFYGDVLGRRRTKPPGDQA
jgi:glycosyltransferase involved in cell wall biosynthesis